MNKFSSGYVISVLSSREKTYRRGVWMIPLVVLAILIMAVFAKAETLPLFERVSEITFESLEGHPFNVSAFQDSVVFLNFWGTWCGPCLKEIPDLVRLSHRFGPDGLKVVGVAVESGSPEAIRNFIHGQGINYRVVIGDMHQVINILQVRGFPSSLLIDRTGLIRKRYFGPQTEAGLTKDITALLSGPVTND